MSKEHSFIIILFVDEGERSGWSQIPQVTEEDNTLRFWKLLK